MSETSTDDPGLGAQETQETQESGPIEPVLVPPRGLVASLLIVLALVAVAAVRWPGQLQGDGRPDLRLHSWADDADERADHSVCKLIPAEIVAPAYDGIVRSGI